MLQLSQLHFKPPVVKLLKFMDNPTLNGLISKGDESTFRWETDHLVYQNNLYSTIL